MPSAGWLYSLSDASMLTANERQKRAFGSYVSAAIVFSAGAHFLLLAFGNLGFNEFQIHYTPAMEQIDFQQRVEVPPPPQDIPRPAVPVISTSVNVDHEITIGSVRFEDNPAQRLPPPPTPTEVDVADQPSFTPYSVRPELRNPDELQRALERHYPKTFKDAGIGGTTLLWVFIDVVGAVQNTRVVQTSGYQELDEAAQTAIRTTAKFSPAYNRDQRVPVWIQLPVTFRSIASAE
jgi:periplasmic protein TonB